MLLSCFAEIHRLKRVYIGPLQVRLSQSQQKNICWMQWCSRTAPRKASTIRNEALCLLTCGAIIVKDCYESRGEVCLSHVVMRVLTDLACLRCTALRGTKSDLSKHCHSVGGCQAVIV